MQNYSVYCKNIKTDMVTVLHTKADSPKIARRKIFMQTRGNYINFLVTNKVL